MADLTGRVSELRRGRWRLTANLPSVVEIDGDGCSRRRFPKKNTDVDASGKKVAQAKLKKWLETLRDHDCTDPATMTFADLASRWQAAVRHEIRPVTSEGYQGYLDRDILPTLGSRIAADVKQADLSALYATKRETVGESSIKHIRATIRARTLGHRHRVA